MSQPPYPYPLPYAAPEPPGPRPQQVTVAAMLLLLTMLANVGVGFTIAFDLVRRAKGASGDLVGAIVLGLVLVLMGLTFALLAVGLLRGKGYARILSYLVCAPALLCGGVMELGLIGSTIDNGVEAPEQVAALILWFLALFGYGAIIVLLSVWPTVRWFAALSRARAHPMP